MKKILNITSKIGLIVAAIMLLAITESTAQRMQHAKPSRPSGGGASSRAASAPKPSVNGGAKKSPSRPAQTSSKRPEAKSNVANKASTQKPSITENRNNNNNSSARDRAANAKDNRAGTGDKNIGNNSNIGNKVNVDNSKRGDVNINVDNSKDINVRNNRNTVVRRGNNYRPYPRPPYRYGGFGFSCYHPFFYHPYRPFFWGPIWHPWGFFIATLTTTAILILVQNDAPDFNSDLAYNNSYFYNYYQPAFAGASHGPSLDSYPPYNYFAEEYYYDQGMWYVKSEGGYTAVAAPVGAEIKKLPDNYETAKLDDGSTNYYWGGTFYEKSSGGYKVVPPTAGTIIEHLPEGGEEIKMGEITFVKLGETYYQPIQEKGKNAYEVADVQPDK